MTVVIAAYFVQYDPYTASWWSNDDKYRSFRTVSQRLLARGPRGCREVRMRGSCRRRWRWRLLVQTLRSNPAIETMELFTEHTTKWLSSRIIISLYFAQDDAKIMYFEDRTSKLPHFRSLFMCSWEDGEDAGNRDRQLSADDGDHVEKQNARNISSWIKTWGRFWRLNVKIIHSFRKSTWDLSEKSNNTVGASVQLLESEGDDLMRMTTTATSRRCQKTKKSASWTTKLNRWVDILGSHSYANVLMFPARL